MSKTDMTNSALTEKFDALFPCGHTNFYKMEPSPIHVFQSRAEGGRFWDVEGREYIDYMGCLGASILGHRHPDYMRSLQSYTEQHSVCSASGICYSEDDITVAEALVKHVPCAEQVKFGVTGSEAVQLAFRLARAHTGKPYSLRFGGHYHGWTDNVFGGVPDPSPKGRPYPINADNSTAGMFPEASHQGLMIPWGYIDILEETLQKYGHEIAIIHFEAMVCNNFLRLPPPGFLERVRELCTQYNIVMSMDEVITGFRVGLSGAQGLLGVTPDIATLGKSFGGGLPISAVVGKAEILGLLSDGKVLGPGTFNGNPLCVRSAKSTLAILEQDEGAVYQEMNRVQKRLTDGLAEIAQCRAIPLRVQSVAGVFYTLFGIDPEQEQYTQEDMADFDKDMSERFIQSMQAEGVYTLGPRWYPSIAHGDMETDRVLDAANKAMAAL